MLIKNVTLLEVLHASCYRLKKVSGSGGVYVCIGGFVEESDGPQVGAVCESCCPSFAIFIKNICVCCDIHINTVDSAFADCLLFACETPF